MRWARLPGPVFEEGRRETGVGWETNELQKVE